MMGGPPMAGFGLRHGASYSEIPIVYDYQFLAPPTQDLFYDREGMLDRAVDLLDPDLRPVPPQPNCADSMQIYQVPDAYKTFFRLRRRRGQIS